jgi:DNA-binding MarR family transcriptional regulator
VAGNFLNKLESKGWIEQRGTGRSIELRLTTAGFNALRAKIPDYANARPRPAG